jgi:hypothetical protein
MRIVFMVDSIPRHKNIGFGEEKILANSWTSFREQKNRERALMQSKQEAGE